MISRFQIWQFSEKLFVVKASIFQKEKKPKKNFAPQDPRPDGIFSFSHNPIFLVWKLICFRKKLFIHKLHNSGLRPWFYDSQSDNSPRSNFSRKLIDSFHISLFTFHFSLFSFHFSYHIFASHFCITFLHRIFQSHYCIKFLNQILP